MPRKCLMLETRDRRQFFTHQKNLPQLMEFSKTFNAEISVVRTSEEPVDLISLAGNLCDNNYEVHKPNFQVLEVKVARPKRTRRKLDDHVKIIRKWIKNQLIDGKSVRLCDLTKRYKKYEFSSSTLCNHFTAVRNELVDEGFRVKKEGRGVYRLC